MRKDCVVLTLMLKMAVRWGDLEQRPALDWEKTSESESRTRYFTQEEWLILPETAEPWLEDLLELAVHTGPRLKEEVTLTGDAVDLECTLAFTDGKGKTYESEKARDRIVRAFKRADLRAGSFHLLRHTAASWVVQKGVPLKTAGDILGHEKPETTQRYAHMALGNLHAAVAQVSV